jgi:KH/beta-lactamase-domain protein
VAIGKHGSNLNEIKRQIGWAPKVIRTPSIPSKTVGEIRGYLRLVAEDRKTWLKKIGRRINREVSPGDNWVRLTALGGFREVGRSSALLTTKDSKVLIDCGVRFSQDAGSPYLNIPEVLPFESLDAVVLTHAHLDHSGLVPLLFKYGFDGPIYCTAPTRDLSSLLLIDYLKVAYGEGKTAPYDSSHIREMVKHCIPLRYGDTTDIAPDLRLTLQNAGHILGSSIAHFHVGDGVHNIALSGDMKFEKTWLFSAAHDNFPRLETLVMESTYGARNDHQPSRKEAKRLLRDIVSRALDRGGKVLVPVFAVGRSQEVMIVLEQLIRNGNVPKVPVYLDGMIWEATAIHTAYPEYLNANLRNLIFQRGENPFLSEVFQNVDHVDKRAQVIEDPEPAIVLATSGMINGGPVMEYFKNWAENPANTLVFVGYQAEGTLGRRLQRGWSEVPFTERGKAITIKVRMQIETSEGFSGHSDRKQLSNFVGKINPKPDRIIFVHGEESKVLELSSAIHRKFNLETRAPKNLETIRLN